MKQRQKSTKENFSPKNKKTLYCCLKNEIFNRPHTEGKCCFRALWINLPLLMTNISLASIAGIIIYSYFRDCDPLTSGAITAVDQVQRITGMRVV